MRSLLSIRIFAVVVATGLFALSCSDGPVLQYDIPGSDNGSDVAGDTIPPKDILPDNQEDRIGEDIGIDLIGVDTNVPDSNGDTGPLPREFGYPCLDNTDCNSGYCVEDVNGLVCSRRCNNDCPDDWSCRTVIVVGDPVTLCMPSGVFLCRSCIKNSQCADGLCLPYEEGNFCSRSCSEYSACPDGYDCVEATDPETSRKSKQCIPSNGTCTCRLKNDTEQRPCSKDNEAGTCLGFQTCHLETGWSECSAAEPTAEICDGLDNDCNRISDDNPELPVGDCFNTVDGIGSCRGEWLCRGQDGWDCFGPIPAAETCNYLDDNCDGSTDEDFKVDGKYVSEENCGQCGVGCDGLIPFAKTTSCDPGINPEDVPQCVVEECIQGYLKAGPQLCRPAISSLCVPCEQDSNCGSEVNKCIQFESGKYCGRDCSPDGIYGPECPGGYQCSDVAGSMQCVPISGTCECTQANHGIKRICEIVNEFGTCQGNEVCDGAVGWVNCSARVPADEICDAIDNDCNGLVDDDPIQPPDPCEKSWTDPVSGTEYTCGGTWSCQDTPSGKEWVCPAKMPSAEVCNAIDDNCNGETDEDFKLAGTNKYNNYDHCGACNVSCAGLVQNAVMKCDATGPQPVCLVDYCNEGWWKASDLSCQRFPESQCLACSSDASCQIPGDVCIPADSVGNTYCMWDCSEDALRPELDPDRKTCPEGYYCRETNDLGQPLFKCFPQSNSCDCLAANAGHVRACVISNSFGRCFGDQTCQPATGWTVCNAQTPSVEICNNNDDDCNGLIDEPFPSVGSTCTAGIGECLGTGNIVCNAVGDGVECTAVAGEPVSEICDLKDNDCDNSVDEDFPDYGKVCFVGTGECLASGTYVCQAGGLGVECNAVQGTPVDETCDDRDNDCDGSVDEDYLLKGRVCAVGVGECFANGVWICSADQSGLECDAIEGLAGQELCDGLDNDCDLQIDELWPERETVCVVGQGACRATGVFRCMADMSGIECSVVAGTPSPEICDGIDNDCDGSIDEDWADLGRACQEGVGECLANGVWTCTADLSGVECSANPGTPVAELCDGKDNDCDGSIDEDWTNKGTACQEGVGECLANGVIVCTADLSGVECSANPGTPVAELCDGLDNDCDGSIDEDWTNKGFACQEGVGECLDTGVIVCTADLSGVECNANPGTPVAELCDGLDNNCNGSIDETWTDKGRPCNEGVGACLDTGVWVCTADFSGIECSANPGTAVAELCDGIDNDCDGSIDETWTNKGRACQEGVGECFDTGVWVCTADQSGIECDAEPGAPVVELCDGLDNDCDGSIDEDWTNKGTACQEGVGECLANGVWTCMADLSGVECSANPGTPVAELCDGKDNDCDGSIDEDWTNKGTACQEGVGECLANGVIVCMADLSGVECSANPGTPVAELCDGLDNDCDGSIDETWTNKGFACQEGVGECLDTGVIVCTADLSGVECNANPGTPVAELCDGLDNNCNGSIDETWTNKGTDCREGIGACSDTGVWVCSADLSGVECSAEPGDPVAELCDDIDNDCDGSIDEDWVNLARACQEGVGECLATGVWTCTADLSDVECSANPGTPVAELCDGLDNDCDGSIDEDWTNKGTACQEGVGECLANGVIVCMADLSGVECNANPGTPVAELCDGLDNDCDGSIDETWTNKGFACQEGVGECLDTGVIVCTADQSGVECNANPGAPVAELCDGLDNNCNGSIDETWTNKGRACQEGVGECLDTGVWVCTADQAGIECDAEPGLPVAEQCDGLDNDCDGSIDETWTNKGTACQEGVGECLASGVWTCTGDLSGVECSANPGTPVAELCDGLDNDCDGSIDEDWTNKGTACQEGVGECLANGVWLCTADLSGVECSANPGTPVAELCDGKDNDCDGSIDETWTNKGFACQEGVGECLDTGVIVCTADLSGVECNANPGTPVAELCDGKDNDCNGSIDETWTNKGTACQEGVGECLDTGVWVCTADLIGVECNANPGTPVAELCDGLDNNCNGSIDETWTNKGTDCREGVGACSDTGVWVCTADLSGVECSAEPGLPVGEQCDDIDNDCDGSIDEDWVNLGRACQEGVGECLANGVWTCTADLSGVECSANPGTPVAELCDGKDNDCDGSIDEVWTNKGTACQEGVGECLANGVWTCMANLSGVECSANPGTPVAELCDGKDNDCNGSIDETWANKGFACQEGVGECLDTGVIVCTADLSGVECNANPGTPVAELCDGKDNNCNGSIDETWTNKGTACQEGVGECLDTGVWVCTADLSSVECNANPGTPVAELCDGLDNDCDGSIDETWTNKGRACQEGIGECLDAGVWVCTADQTGIECDAEPGLPIAEQCDGLDNDCDGNIDEDWTNKGTACQEGVGECLASGVWICTADLSGVECSANPGTPVAELCDGLDNNCNGSIDETWTNKGRACQEGVGECLDAGVWVCNVAQTGIECDAEPGLPVAEQCDGLDNDCDGSIDETWANKGTACQEGVGECLANGVWTCMADLSGVECSANPGTPVAELCDGKDNDCDGGIDEDWTNKGTACQEGVGECLASGVWVCTADLAGVECSANPGTPVAELCDGKDNDCDGSIDEDWTNKGTACQEGVGECLANGVWTCTADLSGVECSANPGTPVAELCDGKDNDCDGSIDETWTNKGFACQEGVGECLDTGVIVCTADQSGVECNANPGTPVAELCDGKDNNCNGSIDETWTNKGTACQEGVGECLDTGVWVCTADFSGVECDADPGVPVAEECDGLDNNCNGSIDETWTNKGRACQEGVGECLDAGVWVCTADQTGIECDAEPGLPVAELCDGLDNDCDGSIDETWTNKGTACQEGVGECLANGVWVCTADLAGVECSANPGTPVAELCDGKDNDCDGSIDETWTNKGFACQEGVGECLDTGVIVCTADQSGVECNANPGTPVAELCDGLDNNCNGSIDETWTNKGRACQEGVGECLDAGVYVCNVAQTGVECDAEPGLPVAEQCDGLDNDCDGSIDEDWTNKGRSCQSGIGECLSNGVYVCTGDMTGVECNAVEGLPVAELCDGKDNDCDGSIDETWTNKGTACEAGVGACQANGVYVCSVDQTNVECNAVVGSPTAEQCDNLDNDCDGDTDETWLNKGTACQAGVGECVASGVYVCTVDKTNVQCNATPGSPVVELCDGLDNDCDSLTDEDFPTKGQVCSAGVGQCQATGTWQCTVAQTGVECNATQGTPSAETCDYLDNDCDGQTDETFKSGVYYVMDEACGNCFTDCTQIYDLPNASGECDSSGVPKCTMVCDAGWYDLNEIPDDGCEFFLDETAVYVSHNDPMAADNAGCGLAPSVLGIGQYPCLTIQYGITRAGTLGRTNVLVSNGEYAEAVTITAGINMKGGYRADTWERDVETTLTTIRGPSSGAGHLMSVTAQNISTSTLFEGFLVHGPANFNPGGNSYALYVVNCTSALVVRDNIIYGGFGGAGANGSSGTDGQDGVNGNAGQDTIETTQYQLNQCNNLSTTPGNQGTYGDGGSRTCGTDDVSGGEGAGASCPDGNDQQSNGASGEPAVSGGSAGTGGTGGYDRYTTNCGTFSADGKSATGMNGNNGGDGTNGSAGAGCPPASNVGSVSGNHWVGTSGGNGGNGTPGGGGGGGGAGGGADVDENCSGTDDCLGGSGGGGGSGACGGTFAAGGTAGGGAFAVFISFSAGSSDYPVLDSNIIVRGQGGRGGNGGLGGAGGLGGDGANGGNVLGHWAFAMGQGGRGGQGGDGGHGGGGGGGCGGASVGVFVFNGQGTQPSYATQNTVTGSASGGQGGAGGPSLGSSGTAGSDGYAANVHFN